MMSKGAKGSASRSAGDRARVLKEWEESGISARRFAERMGISPWTLYDWRRRERAATDQGELVLGSSFVRVEAMAAQAIPTRAPSPSPNVIVVFPDASRIEFQGDARELLARTVTEILRRC